MAASRTSVTYLPDECVEYSPVWPLANPTKMYRTQYQNSLLILENRETECHKLKSALGYVSKNGCK